MLPPGPKQPSALTIFHWLYRPFQFFDACARRYGDPFLITMTGLPPLVVFSNPDAVRDIFSGSPSAMHAGEFNKNLGAFLGTHSLLLLDGEAHLRERRLIMPPFHGERLNAYGRLMVDITHDVLDTWPVGSPFPVHPHMQAITLRVIIRAVFGIDDPERVAEMASLLRELLEVAASPLLLVPALRIDLGRATRWGRFVRLSNRADELLFSEIRRRRRAGAQTGSDVLSLLLAARDERGHPMADDELRDELVTLLVAGHETTATALAWALRWTLDTPSIHARLRDEIDRASHGGELAPEKVARLELLDAVVRETLRLQPVVPIVGRVLKEPATIGGVELPAGVAAIASIYLAHRRPETYPDPTRFDPDRFLRDKPPPNVWFPFGGGIRRCVGMAFAMYEMKMVLAAILSRAVARLAPGPRPRTVRRSVTLAPSRGMPIVVDRMRPRRATPKQEGAAAWTA